MTVAAQVKQTLAGLKGAQAALEAFASIEENPEAKFVLSRNADRLKQVIGDLHRRVGVLEYEEPQYKGF
ncbi:MAG: DUF1657 domain-containing protein [Peptococcaceae bacterium]|nr:DUF1657 domain-containing protein [Peptococcaceae bacterium]